MSTNLPITRIKTIMKSSPDVECIGHDSALLVGKATELFIGFLTTEAHKNSIAKNSAGKRLEYNYVAEIVQNDDRLDFLREMVPRKITVKQFKEIMKKKNREQQSDSSDSSSDSESDSESGSSSDASESSNKSGSSNSSKESSK